MLQILENIWNSSIPHAAGNFLTREKNVAEEQEKSEENRAEGEKHKEENWEKKKKRKRHHSFTTSLNCGCRLFFCPLEVSFLSLTSIPLVSYNSCFKVLRLKGRGMEPKNGFLEFYSQLYGKDIRFP